MQISVCHKQTKYQINQASTQM